MTTIKVDVTIYDGKVQCWLEARCKGDLAWCMGEKGLLGEVGFDVYRMTLDSEHKIGHTYMTPMPGCCGIVVSHNTFLTDMTKHSGLSDPFRKVKEKIAKEFGYTMMIATTDMANIPAVGNFFKSKYRFVETFTNKRTNNLIGIGIKKVK